LRFTGFQWAAVIDAKQRVAFGDDIQLNDAVGGRDVFLSGDGVDGFLLAEIDAAIVREFNGVDRFIADRITVDLNRIQVADR